MGLLADIVESVELSSALFLRIVTTLSHTPCVRTYDSIVVLHCRRTPLTVAL
jgi:hypothetical protein